MSISNPSGQPPAPMGPLEADIARLRNLLHWLMVLVIANVILSAYVADFVHTILQDIHQVGG